MSVVAIIALEVPKTVSIQTQPPDENVFFYGGELFRQGPGGSALVVQTWTRDELESGVVFLFDPGASAYLLRLRFQIVATSSILVDLTYDPPPPAPEPYDEPLPIGEGALLDRDWVFVKVGGVA